MDFIETTDRLSAAGVTHSELAGELGVSVQAVKQARLDSSSPSYRRPPEGWKEAAAALARRHGAELQELADALEGGGEG